MSFVKTTPLAHQNRSKGLDGLRGIAILMVLCAHFYARWEILLKLHRIGPLITKCAVAGVYGVQLFFVLSGFLITGILLDTKEARGYFIELHVNNGSRACVAEILR